MSDVRERLYNALMARQAMGANNPSTGGYGTPAGAKKGWITRKRNARKATPKRKAAAKRKAPAKRCPKGKRKNRRTGVCGAPPKRKCAVGKAYNPGKKKCVRRSAGQSEWLASINSLREQEPMMPYSEILELAAANRRGISLGEYRKSRGAKGAGNGSGGVLVDNYYDYDYHPQMAQGAALVDNYYDYDYHY